MRARRVNAQSGSPDTIVVEMTLEEAVETLRITSNDALKMALAQALVPARVKDERAAPDFSSSSLAPLACDACGHAWTADARKVSQGPLKCPACGSGALRRRDT